jgi:uncharacterized membrane protein YraQ (UPF0718 family)
MGKNPADRTSVRAMFELLGLDAIFAEMILGIGLALVLGNAFALFKHRRGERPEGAEGELRMGRVMFLMSVGGVMAVWGAASVFG